MSATKVRVYDHHGSEQIHDADIVNIVDGALWVMRGNAVASVYAAGKWINGDVITDDKDDQ